MSEEANKYGKLLAIKYNSKEELGNSAGKAIISKLNEILKSKKSVRMIFAAAPSQNEMLSYLVSHKDKVDWNRVTAFHMDEYIGLKRNSPQLFSSFLKRNLFDHLDFGKVHLIDSNNDNEICRYSALLKEEKIDIVCLGIGENGHIAFNDPPVADFKDSDTIKIVTLDSQCRQQQVNDGCFNQLSEVPAKAISLTIPTLMNADYLFCVVPGATKKEAVYKTLHAELSEECPSTILRTHDHCILYVDNDSCPDNLE